MKITGNQLRTGNVIDYRARLWRVVRTQHVKPGKGGAFVQVELKDISDGTKLNERFRSSEVLNRARLEQARCQFLFADDSALHFMDCKTFEQFEADREILDSTQLSFLEEGMEVTIESFSNRLISVALPEHVVLEVAQADTTVKGQTASSSYKPATLSNGLRIQVPPYITAGMHVKVSTQDARFVERVQS